MADPIDRLAELAGIEPSFRDFYGRDVRASSETKRALLAAMGYDVSSDAAAAATLRATRERRRSRRALPPAAVVREGARARVACAVARGRRWQIVLEGGGRLHGRIESGASARSMTVEARLPLGYHRLTLDDDTSQDSCALIVVPSACFLPAEMERGRAWALATQLYALRSASDWGVGDFSALASLATLGASAGASAIGLNPLHELRPASPEACSPYAPSSRRFLNPLYVDVTAVPEFAHSPQARAWLARPTLADRLRSLRAGDLVDYRGVARLKHEAFELLFRAFRTAHLERAGDRRAAAFRRFVRDGGSALERLAVYEALDERFGGPGSPGWPGWPPEYRSPDAPPVRQFAADRRARVDYYAYLQWIADEQLARAAATAQAHGTGLYRDLAVGADPGGADAWGDPRAAVAGASLGAPPDPLNRHGQNWGVSPLSPHELRERAYAPLVELLRANMRHAQILRIDHVMSLRRAFWIPRGGRAADGAYVRSDFDAMLGIVALESVRNRCAVVGEDLGTLPHGFRARMCETRALSSRVVYFERKGAGRFLSAKRYPRIAAASIGTHDLPPLANWWIAGDPDGTADPDARAFDRLALVDALEGDGAAAPPVAQRLRDDARRGGTLAVAGELSQVVHRFLASAPSMLAVVAIEDVLGETGAVNVPGTIAEYPNWRRRRSLALEALESDGRLYRVGAIMRAVRNAAVTESQP